MPSLSWNDLIAGLPGVITRHEPSDEAALLDAERRLGQRFPAELVALLAESDRGEGEYKLGLGWPVHRIIKENLDLRGDDDLAQLYMPFD